MTLTYFKARSTWVAYVFEWVDLLKCHLKGKTCRILANGQDIDYPEKKNGPRASSAPILELFSLIFKHVYWYMQQISGERLQDHWSSGFFIRTIWTSFILSIILCENIFKKFESTNMDLTNLQILTFYNFSS